MPLSSKLKIIPGSRITRSVTRSNVLKAQQTVTFLPVEILLLIFTLVRQAYKKAKTSVKEEPSGLTEDEIACNSWVGVSYVCWHWRAVALGCPSFWSFIELKGGRCLLAMEMLKRSKGCKLSLFIDYKDLTGEKYIARTPALITAQSHFEQWTELAMELPSGANSILKDIIGPRGLPNLVSVTFLGRDHYWKLAGIFGAFHGIRDSLRELNIANVDLIGVPASKYPPFLTRLQIYGIIGPSFKSFLNQLLRISSLDHIDINLSLYRSAIDIHLRDHPIFASKINLTQLTVLAECLEYATALLSAVAADTLHFDIGIKQASYYISGHAAEDFFKEVGRHVSPTSGCRFSIRKYSFDISHSNQLIIKGFAEDHPRLMRTSGRFLTLSFSNIRTGMEQLIGSACKYLGEDKISNINSDGLLYNPKEWLESQPKARNFELLEWISESRRIPGY